MRLKPFTYYTVVVLVVLILMIYTSILFLFLELESTQSVVNYVSFDIIEVFSILIFIASILLSNNSIKWYSFFLIFNVLALPSSFDNILPSVVISATTDQREVLFPIITHIDFFLFYGIIRYVPLSFNKFNLSITGSILSLSIIILALSSLINIVFFSSKLEALIILANSYHIRYAILLILILFLTNILNYKHYVINGIVFSLFFLIAESLLFSCYFNSFNRLMSGTLRANTFGSILTATSIYFYWLCRSKKLNKLYFFVAIICYSAAIFTWTRTAIFLFIIYLALESFIALHVSLRNKSIKPIIIPAIFIFITTIGLGSYGVSDRLNPKHLIIKNIDFNKDGVNNKINFENNNFTKSLSLRLNHFNTSLQMINAQPLIGIGTGLWNIKKEQFGSKEKNLMDSHNDLLASISQYGIPAGLLLFNIVFLLPIYVGFKKELWKDKENNLNYLYIISLVMMIAGLTNANVFKHQIYGFLIFISLYMTTSCIKQTLKNG